MKVYDITVLVIYIVVNVGYGLWNNYKSKSILDYAIAGKQYGAFTVFLTIAATFIGGGFTIGIAGKSYAIGLFAIFTFLGVTAKEFFIARWVAPQLKHFPDAISVGDIVGNTFGKWGKGTTGLLGFIVSIGIVAGQIAALSKIFEEFFEISALYSIILGMSIVTFYSAIGGMIAVIRTDRIQFFVLFVGILSVLFFALSEVGSISEAIGNIPKKQLSMSHESVFAFVALFVFWTIGETLTPAYFSRLLISKNYKQIIKASYAVGIFSSLFIFVPAIIGYLGYSFDLSVGENSDVVLPQLINIVLPWWWRPIVLAAILSVIMSSSDSFLNSGAVTLVHDFLKPLLPDFVIKHELNLIKVLTVAGGVFTIFFTLSGDDVIKILGQSYLFWAPVVLVPLLLSIWRVRVSKQVFVYSSITSGSLTFLLYQFGSLGEFYCVVAGFCVSVVFYSMHWVWYKKKHTLE